MLVSRILCHAAVVAFAILAQVATAQEPQLDLYGDPLPPGAVARLGTVRFRAAEGVMAASYSADGTRLIGLGRDALYHWDAADGRLVLRVPHDARNLEHVAFSLDRRWACAHAFRFDDEKLESVYEIHVWDLESGRLVRSLPLADVSVLAMTADGGLVVAGTRRGTVHILEVASGAELLSFAVSDRDITTLAVSPDSKWIAVGSSSTKLQVWDWQAGAEPEPVSESEGYSMSAAFSPDGRYLAEGGEREGGIKLYHVVEWTRVDTPLEDARFRNTRGLTFSPDGTKVAATGYVRESAMIWDVATGKLLHALPMRPEASGELAFSPDGRRLIATSGWNETPPRIWNVETGEQQETVGRGHRVAPSTIAFVGNGETIVTAGDDGTARIWDVASGRQLRMMSHHPDHVPDRQYNVWIRSMAASNDGRLVATSSLDESVRLWNAATGEQIFRLPGHGRLGGHRALAFVPDGSKLASWGDDMYLRIWDTGTGKALAEHAIRPSGVEIPEETDGAARIGGMEMWRFSMGQTAISPDGEKLVTTFGIEAYVFDVQSGRELAKIDVEGGGHILGLAVSPNSDLFATSAWGPSVETPLPNGRIRSSSERNHLISVRRLADGEELHRFLLPEGGAGPVAFSRDGALLAMGVREADGPIRIYRMDNGEQVAEITGFGSVPRALAFSPDGELLAGSLADTTVVIWKWR